MKIDKSKTYKTRDGRAVEILTTSMKVAPDYPYPVLGIITDADGFQRQETWTHEGHAVVSDGQNLGDLVEVKPFTPGEHAPESEAK